MQATEIKEIIATADQSVPQRRAGRRQSGWPGALAAPVRRTMSKTVMRRCF